MHPQIHAADPFRPPNWREERVISLLEAAGGPRRASAQFDDEFIRKYRAFLVRWREYATAEDKMRLFPRFPELYHAQRFHERPDSESQSVLEARILSGASNSSIAHNFGTSPGVVRWYEKLFYNVRERLDRRDYIRDVVLVPMLRRAAAFEDHDVLTDDKRQTIYKLMGYVGGPTVLDFMLTGFQRVTAPTRITQLGDWLDQSFNNLVRQKGLMAIQAFSCNKFTVMQLLEMCSNVVQSAELAKQSGGTVTEFHTNVQAFLEQISIGVTRNIDSGQDSQWDSGSIEPRADDYTQLLNGEQSPALTVFDGFRRPEPTPKEV